MKVYKILRNIRDNVACRQQVAAVLLSLEDELAVLDLRYADLLQSVQSLAGSDEEDVEVCVRCLLSQQQLLAQMLLLTHA